MTDALSAAAEPTRRRILQLLAPRPRTVSEIAAEFPVTRSAISQHLLLLEQVGLVAAEKVGRQRIYRVLPGGLHDLQAEINRFWTHELDLLVSDAHQRHEHTDRSSDHTSDRPHRPVRGERETP
ncbi:ArsR/SmtB family transcription factor [Nocardioides donggukensis]|uniref:Winged helix-turn-helix transcriptional regulator n=1 Tax=Nocardioides donggukensis TaxID=2774019 RepID=A0A927KAR1_9ACTN|nr:metalloregulator ArsR/SmtB family transcription factor [Nocardioides donggukensis]MBD8870760.1 winged helix-turn-helix transcriptional regulator [Nocardioides donggukensis]